MQPAQVHRAGHDARPVAAGSQQAARGAGQVAAAGVGDDHRVGVPAIAGAHLLGDLDAERFDAADAEGGVQAGVEEAGLLQRAQVHVE